MHDAALLGEHDDRLPHRGARRRAPAASSREHHLVDPATSCRPSAPPGCSRAKSSRRNPFSRAAPPRARRRARARPSCSSSARGRADTPLRAPTRRAPRRTACASAEPVSPGDGDGSYPEALEMLEQGEQLVGLAALRDEDRDVVGADDAEIAVDAVDGMEEGRGRARRRERRGDLPADEPRLAHAGDDDAARRFARSARPRARTRRRAAPRRRASASRSRRTTRRPRSTISSGAHARRAPTVQRPLVDVRVQSRRSHSPRALSSSSANSRTAPRPPCRVELQRAHGATSGTALPTATGQSDESQHGHVGEVVADERGLRRRDAVALEHGAETPAASAPSGSCATSSTSSSRGAQPHAFGHASGDDGDARCRRAAGSGCRGRPGSRSA